MSSNIQPIEELAREILKLSRNTLLVNMRFLDAALSQFEYVAFPGAEIATNGKHLVFDPKHVLRQYKKGKEYPVRDYLHMLLHCIFRHMYGLEHVDREYWDVACDMAVEAVICDLKLKCVYEVNEALERDLIDGLRDKIGVLSAEKIYAYLKQRNMPIDKFNQLKEMFRSDNHILWYPYEISVELARVIGLVKSRSSMSDDDTKESSEDENGSNTSHAITGTSNSESSDEDSIIGNASQEQIWKEISKRMQMDLETFSKSRGDNAGTLIQNLKAVNREKYDYTAFLQTFASRGEVMKIDDDEFDYIFYTYGLKLYDNMPLIEPLEYKEVKRIKEFVIAIDTSGSVMGEEVQNFVTKTYNILKSTESFFSKINLHIIQCDADIQEHVKITNQDEFDEYLKTMTIKGFGGTDFRPVFETVDELIANHEFTNLKGLIYFTDGYGEFPKRKPDYETAFVFVNDDYENPEVPPWAIKLVLQRDEL